MWSVIMPSFAIGGCEGYAMAMARELETRGLLEGILTSAELEDRLSGEFGTGRVRAVMNMDTHHTVVGRSIVRQLASQNITNVLVVAPLPVSEPGTTLEIVPLLARCEEQGVYVTAVFQLCHRVFDTDRHLREIAATLCRSQRWIAVSTHNQTNLAATFGIEPDFIDVVPNGVDVHGRYALARPRRTQGGLRAELAVSKSSRLCVQVGRLVESKRHIDSLMCLPRLADDVHLVVAGDGPARRWVERAAIELGVANRVHLLGNRQDVHSLLEQSDVYLHPSIAEGASFALLEAMAKGCPVVASRWGSNAEIVRHDVDGFLHTPEDPEDQARHISRCLRAEHRIERMVDSARTRVERLYDYRTMVSRTLFSIE